VKKLSISLALAVAAIVGMTTPSFAATAFTVSAQVNTIATISIATTAFSFTSTTNTNLHLPANENPTGTTSNVTGSIRTTKAGVGTISVVAPAGPLAGAAGGSITISQLQITCTVGSANSGVNATPTGLAALTALTASSSTQCAKYNNTATGTSAQVGLLLSLFLDETTVIADTYAALAGFSVTASAT
jgi:hypothetical protein